jgi:hypothetical protein
MYTPNRERRPYAEFSHEMSDSEKPLLLFQTLFHFSDTDRGQKASGIYNVYAAAFAMHGVNIFYQVA